MTTADKNLHNLKKKSVILDLGGVYFTNGAKSFVSEVISAFSLPAELVTFVINGPLGSEYRCGRLTAAEFWRQALDRWKITTDWPQLNEMWVKAYVRIDGTAEIVRRDYELPGTRCFFLSDNVQERVDFLEQKYHFTSEFDGGIFSHQVGMRKPEPAIYREALKIADAAPADCVYVDDKAELLVPAAELGLLIIQFKSPAQLAASLRQLGFGHLNVVRCPQPLYILSENLRKKSHKTQLSIPAENRKILPYLACF